MFSFRNKGFTLIELLIAMALIGTLAGVTLVAINPIAQFQKARDVGRKKTLRELATILKLYYVERGVFPANTDDAVGWDCSNIDGYINPLVTDGYVTQAIRDNPNSDGCGYRYHNYDSLSIWNGCPYNLVIIMVPMERQDQVDVSAIPDCYAQKGWFSSSGYSGVSLQGSNLP